MFRRRNTPYPTSQERFDVDEDDESLRESLVEDDEPASHHRRKCEFPVSIIFILVVQFFERYYYYGIRENLKDYNVEVMSFTKAIAKSIDYSFNFLCYILSIVGAVIADSFVGKVRTIYGFLLVYFVGHFLMACMSSTSPMDVMFMQGLVILGIAGIKPCMPALGGDQFTNPMNSSYFFYLYYLVTNLAVVLALYTTAALGKPGIWLNTLPIAIALIIFIIGNYKSKYQESQYEHRFLERGLKCILYALKQKMKSKEKRSHWLEHAAPRFNDALISDVKVTIPLLVMFLPMPIFWALYFEQWGAHMETLSSHMNRFFGNKFLDDSIEEFTFINPICVVIFIPIFKYGIYPLFGLVKFLRTPLQRIVAGCMVAAIAYIIAAVMATEAMRNEREGAIFFAENAGHHIVFNNMGFEIKLCTEYEIYTNDDKVVHKETYGDYTIPDKSLVRIYDIKPKEKVAPTILEKNTYNQFTYIDCTNPKITSEARIAPGQLKLMSCMYSCRGAKLMPVDRHEDGYPMIRAFAQRKDNKDEPIYMTNFYQSGELKASLTGYDHDTYLPLPGVYTIKINDTALVTNYEFKARSYYFLAIRIIEENKKFEAAVYEIFSNDRITSLNLCPTYVVFAAAEVMFAISGIEFAYTQAPDSMKCFMQACWLLAVAFGIPLQFIIKSLVSSAEISTIFYVYAGIMFVDGAILAVLAWFYKYV